MGARVSQARFCACKIGVEMTMMIGLGFRALLVDKTAALLALLQRSLTESTLFFLQTLKDALL